MHIPIASTDPLLLLLVCSCVGKNPVHESTVSMGNSATTCILAGVIPSVVLMLTNIIGVVVAVLITRHCLRNTTQKNSTSNKESTYEQVEGTKPYSNIAMNENPAYGPLQ